MNPETETAWEIGKIYEGLKASEIETQREVEELFGKAGTIDKSSSSYVGTIINSVELDNPRFAGCVTTLVRSYGPFKEGEQVLVNDAIEKGFVGSEIVLFFRDQGPRSLLSKKEIEDITESFEGMSAGGETGLNFDVERVNDNYNEDQSKTIITLKKFRDFAGNYVDLVIKMDLGNVTRTNAALDFEQIVAQASVGSPMTVRKPRLISVLVTNGSQTDFDQSDPELTEKVSRGVSLALKTLEVILHKADPKSKETLKLKHRTVRDIMELNGEKHPDLQWMLKLLTDGTGDEDGGEDEE